MSYYLITNYLCPRLLDIVNGLFCYVKKNEKTRGCVPFALTEIQV